jgi:heme oxygenase
VPRLRVLILYQNEVSTPLSTSTNLRLTCAVNIATRPIHSQLNKLIIARLPLALPPHTTNPSTYVSGLLHIAPIYITFESLWQSLLDATPLPTTLVQPFPFQVDHKPDLCPEPKTNPLLTPPGTPPSDKLKVCPRTQQMLSHLHVRGLLRSDRLRSDIRVLTRTPAHEIEQQLAVVALKGRLADFIAHTKKAVEAKPHVLLAYTWVLYMALFAGGRILRKLLKDAGGTGPTFWERDPSPIRPYAITSQDTPRRQTTGSETLSGKAEGESIRLSARSRSRSDNDAAYLVPGMEFFHFAGDQDGEDIKNLYKARIKEAETILTDGEKEDIIIEAQHIFTFMISLVSDLDSVMGTRDPDSALQPRPPVASRDSIDLAQERIEKMRVDSAHEKLEGRQLSFLGVDLSELANPLMHLKGARVFWDVIIKSLQRHFSNECSAAPQVSFSSEEVRIPPRVGELDRLGGNVVFALFSFLVFIMVPFGCGCCGMRYMICMIWHPLGLAGLNLSG